MAYITHPNVEKLIKAGESEKVEFKESFNEKALEAIGAFSNAQGGIVLIGVTDSGTVCGFQQGKKTLEDIANRIQEVTDPRIQPSLSVVPIENKNVLIIQVAKNTGIPVSIRGCFYKRSGKTRQRMSHEEIVQRITASTGLSWDAHIEPGATLDDLDPSLIKRFVEATNKLGRRPIPQQTRSIELLCKLELVKDTIPTRAALLLFGKNPGSYFSSAFLKMGRFRSPTNIVDDREAHGALVQQLDEAMAWFRERLSTEFIIQEKAEREVRWEYPLDAVREAIVNVLCHRDFVHGGHSQIRLYDDRLEFRNAGSLPPPLTPELLLEEHDSIPRNRKIAEIFYYMGFIERWGSGTLRIAESLKRESLPKPEFTSESGRFRLVFYKQAPTAAFSKNTNLLKHRLQVISYLKTYETITNAEYQRITGVSKRTATRELNELTKEGTLLSEGGARGRGKYYRLSSR